eukprot:13190-Heterococcus_DN1.PRE.4
MPSQRLLFTTLNTAAMSSSAVPGKIKGSKKPLIAHRDYLVKQRTPSLCNLDDAEKVSHKHEHSSRRVACAVACRTVMRTLT